MKRPVTWIVGRTVATIVTLFGVSVLIFGAIHTVPGGYAEVLLGPLGTPEAKAEVSERFGLDGSLPDQYRHWAAAVLSGDFGTSLQTGNPVAHDILDRAPVTLELALLAGLTSLVLGVGLGVLAAATSSGGVSQPASRLLPAFGLSIPDFI